MCLATGFLLPSLIHVEDEVRAQGGNISPQYEPSVAHIPEKIKELNWSRKTACAGCVSLWFLFLLRNDVAADECLRQAKYRSAIRRV